MNNTKAWRILMTKPRAGKKVCDHLAKLNIEHYCPAGKTPSKGLSNGKFDHIMFDRSVFVRIWENQIEMVKRIDGVQNLVYWLQQPATMAAAEVETIKNFVAIHENIMVEKITVNASQRAATFFINSSEDNRAGQQEKLEYTKAILPSLGVALVAPAIRGRVEVLKVVSSRYSIPNIFTGSYR